MRRRARRLALALALGAAAAEAADVRDDGMPCVDAVCVGDEASALVDVPWETAVEPARGVALREVRVSPAALARLARALRADEAALAALAPYWLLRRLDADGLRALAAVRAVCEPPGVAGRLEASYVDAQGVPTVVAFEPVAPAAGAPPRFVVAAIVQRIEADGAERQRAIGEAMAARYAGVPAYASATRPGATWVPASAEGPQLRLLAPFGDPVERAAWLRGHPECAGDDGTLSLVN
ncbi:MAG TPA: hypothetical protein VFZ93_12630 [Albitalea sp.]